MEILGRLLGWTLLGAVIGVGISFFIPNLRSGRALFGGSLGGSLGAIGFLAAALLLADQPGRLLGASIIGFGIGMMIFWEEERHLQSNSHLLVHWNATETSKILLGKEPIWLGSSADAQIPLSKSKYAPLTAKIFKQENQVMIEFHPDYAQQTGIKVAQQELLPGKRRTFAEISLEIVDEVQNDSRVIEVYLGHESSLSPHQLKLLRIIAAVADADGKISPTEMEIILDKLSQVFADNPQEQTKLREELKDYLLQGVDTNLEVMIAEITDPEERQLILSLSRQILGSHDTQDLEWTAYQTIVKALNVPLEVLTKLESELGTSYSA
jgi:hypothetical protein